MAVGATLLTSAYDNVDRTAYTTASISPAANSLLLLFTGDTIAISSPPRSVPTSGHGTWEFLGDRASGVRRVGAWVLQCDGSPGAGTITLTENDMGSGTTSTGTAWSVIEVTGHHTTIPVRQVVFPAPPGNSATSYAFTISDPVDANSRPFAFFRLSTNASITERTNWTELSDNAGDTPNGTFQSQWRSDAFETTASGTFAIATHVGVAVEIAEAAAADDLAAMIQTRASTAGVADATVTVEMPTSITAGDLLIASVATDGAATAAAGGGEGWTEISAASNGSEVRLTVLAKVAAGGDALNLTLGSAVDSTTHVMRIVGHGVSNVATDIEIGTPATGVSTTPDPPSVTPAADAANLFIAVAASDDDDGPSVPSAPTGYTPEAQVESASSATSCMLQVGVRQVITGAAQDPAGFALAASEEWVTQSMSVPPAAGAPAATFRQHLGLVQVMAVAS